MKRHDQADVGLDSGPEWDQLHGVQPSARHLDDRQCEMGVRLGVAVPREVLTTRHHPVFLQATDEGPTEGGYACRILTVRARVDDGIVGVVVDVEIGREINVDPECAPLDRRDPPFLVRHVRVPRGTERHLRREDRRAAEIDRVGQEVASAGPHAGAVFQIRRDEERESERPPGGH